jgi:peptide/nickel transport system permease protein
VRKQPRRHPTGRRFAQYGLLLGLLLVGSFALPRLAPGDPLTYLVGGNEAAAFSSEERERALAQFGLDAPLHEQFVDHVAGVASGDLGTSVRYGAAVSDVLLDRLPWTLLLVGLAGVLAAALALSTALAGARRRGAGTGDAHLLTGILLLSATPPFFLGMLILAIVSAELGLLPAYGASASGGDTPLVGVLERLVMPLATLTLTTTGVVYLIARSALHDELAQGYVRFARAKGVSEQRILRRHVLRNALLPIVTIFMVSLGDVLGGAVVVETVFSYPGLGTAIYEAVLARDYPLLQGALLLVAVVVVAANAVADGLYTLIDPRVRRADDVPR